MAMTKMFLALPPSALQSKQITASVGFVSPHNQPDKFLVIRNKRGWDIPGGHVEANESSEEAFTREVMEETASEMLEARLIAVLESVKNPATGIAVYKASAHLGEFKPHEEILELAIASLDELRNRYFGDKDLLEELISLL